jgi:hypothetical protein
MISCISGFRPHHQEEMAERWAATTTTSRRRSGNGKSRARGKNGGTRVSIGPLQGRHMTPSCPSASTPCSYIRVQRPKVTVMLEVGRTWPQRRRVRCLVDRRRAAQQWLCGSGSELEDTGSDGSQWCQAASRVRVRIDPALSRREVWGRYCHPTPTSAPRRSTGCSGRWGARPTSAAGCQHRARSEQIRYPLVTLCEGGADLLPDRQFATGAALARPHED